MSKAAKRRIHRNKPHRRRRRPTQPQQAIVVRHAAKPWIIPAEEAAILKNAICKGATDQEMEFCLTVAKRYELDPFQQQIWFIPRWDSKAIMSDGKVGGLVWQPQVALNGLLHIAARDHRDFGSYDKPEYGPMIEVKYRKYGDGRELTLKVPEWASIAAWKKGASRPTVAQVWWEEIYKNIDYSPKVWDMPRHMLAKCAKAHATRTAYPKTGGLLIPEETQSREFTQVSPEGRIIVSPADRAAAIDVDPHLTAYEQREQEGLKKLNPEQRKIVEDRIAKANQTEKAERTEFKKDQDAAFAPALFYKQIPGKDLWLIDGDYKLKHEHRDLLMPLYVRAADAIHATPQQLGKLISRLEQLKVPFKCLDRQPGE